MKILVIGSCSGNKKHKLANQLQKEDFISPERLRQRTEELSAYKAPAAKMYTGQQHRYLMEGLEQVREIYGQAVVDLHIISAGYGLLNECDIIVPYDVTFPKKKREILARSNSLQTPERVETLIADYELIFFLLGKEYVQALQLRKKSFRYSGTTDLIFLLARTNKKYLPSDLPPNRVVESGKMLANCLKKLNQGVTNYNLKGFLFKKLCEAVCREGFQVFKEVKRNPQMIRGIALGNR
ncbi:MAG: hypothetical protein OXI94_10755 [Gemmatimonadota bacterium]|nr:hypothetical protein [Gemmatimonadota bacterium]MDE2955266.1 hypothetical protein [Gemmatimonadota bacterium]